MDYLDNKLKYPKPEQPPEERMPKQNSLHKAFVAFTLGHFSYFMSTFFIARRDIVRKTALSKNFYSKWFPIYVLGYVIYPLDNYLWSAFSSQFKFYQMIVFDSSEVESQALSSIPVPVSPQSAKLQ